VVRLPATGKAKIDTMDLHVLSDRLAMFVMRRDGWETDIELLSGPPHTAPWAPDELPKFYTDDDCTEPMGLLGEPDLPTTVLLEVHHSYEHWRLSEALREATVDVLRRYTGDAALAVQGELLRGRLHGLVLTVQCSTAAAAEKLLAAHPRPKTLLGDIFADDAFWVRAIGEPGLLCRFSQ